MSEDPQIVDEARPSTWLRFRPGLCEGCAAGCCHLPVEVTASDLTRMGLISADEAQGSLKKVARRLEGQGIIRSFRARTGLFILEERERGACLFLGADRRCTIYEKRPEVCRRFPEIGPRPGYCPARRFLSPEASKAAARACAPGRRFATRRSSS